MGSSSFFLFFFFSYSSTHFPLRSPRMNYIGRIPTTGKKTRSFASLSQMMPVPFLGAFTRLPSAHRRRSALAHLVNGWHRASFFLPSTFAACFSGLPTPSPLCLFSSFFFFFFIRTRPLLLFSALPLITPPPPKKYTHTHKCNHPFLFCKLNIN